jgi:transposase
MSRARLVITAVVVEGRGVREVARAYEVSPGWVSRLVARYREEGEAAFEPRSRRPRHSPRATPPEVVERIIELRRRLVATGDDAGPETIRWHLAKHDGIDVSTMTVLRYLRRAGLVTPQPHKRPRSSYVRFQAELPNETWQSDFTHYGLALQLLLDAFVAHYNGERPHRSLPDRQTPASSTRRAASRCAYRAGCTTSASA